MGDEIDDIEFARQMLRLQVNKYEENRNRGMKHKQVVEKSHNIIPLSNFEEKIIFNILVKIPPRYIH
uniref:Putative ovule protein n=1 Tax=Solanum chacoense TaxID=4108 RepID=A0A0V0HGG9_SOLCH